MDVDQNVEERRNGTKRYIVSSGNSEIDRRLGGGISEDSLILVEGENDTGKSVVCQQLTYGALYSQHRVAYFTTENSIRSLLDQMGSLSLDISDFYAWGYIRIFPLHLEGVKWSTDQMKTILEAVAKTINSVRENVIFIDSLTIFTTYSTEEDTLTFLTKLKDLCDEGKTIFITLHQHAFKEDTLVRIRSACDCHLLLRKDLIGDKYVNSLEVSKMRGAKKTSGNFVSFEVHPGFGLKVIPITQVKI